MGRNTFKELSNTTNRDTNILHLDHTLCLMVITCPLSILEEKVNPKERRRELQKARRASMTKEQRNKVNMKRHEAWNQKTNASWPCIF